MEVDMGPVAPKHVRAPDDGSLDDDEPGSKRARVRYFKTRWGGVYEVLEEEHGVEVAMTEMVSKYGTDWRDGLEQLERTRTIAEVMDCLQKFFRYDPVHSTTKEEWVDRQSSDLLNALVAACIHASLNAHTCMPNLPNVFDYPTLADAAQELRFAYAVLHQGRVDAYDFIVERGFHLGHARTSDFLHAVLSSKRNSAELYERIRSHATIRRLAYHCCADKIMCPAIAEAVVANAKENGPADAVGIVARLISQGSGWKHGAYKVRMVRFLLEHGADFNSSLWLYDINTKTEMLIKLATEEKMDVRPYAQATMKELVEHIAPSTVSQTKFPLKSILALQKVGVPIPTWAEMGGRIFSRRVYQLIRAHHGKPNLIVDHDGLMASRIIASNDHRWLREAIKDGMPVTGAHLIQVLRREKTSKGQLASGLRSVDQKVKLIKVLLTGVKELTPMAKSKLVDYQKNGPVAAFKLLQPLLAKPSVR